MKKLTFLFIVLASSMLCYAENPQWLNFTNGNQINAIVEEGNTMWVGTDGGLVSIDKTTGDPTFYNSSNSGLPNNYVWSIAIDGSGTKWIGTLAGGLAQFDGTNWTVYHALKSGLPNNFVLSIAIDGSGTK
ncbi:MAG: two-component regulator propeller domain-containing protein, partial [Chloroherpetonaceae bacterium]